MAPGLKVTQARVITSEWIKLRSLRSTVYTLIAAVGITVGLGLLFCSFAVARWDSLNAQDRARINPIDFSLRGTFLAQLAIGVLGVLLITGEYSTGMIRATMSTVPKRLPVLWAKLGLFAVVALVASMASVFIAFLGGQAILSSKHVGVSLSDPGVLRVVVGSGLYLAVVGLLGMALGFLVRNTAGAITTLFGVLLILPVLGEVLPADWASDVVPYLPSNAGQAVMQLHPDPNTLAPWTGFALFVGYTAAAVVAAAVLLKRRDA
jgi:ABC-type transport system involved in multi-copper enzyme maturation permease subunit